MNQKQFATRLTQLCDEQRQACLEDEASFNEMVAALISNLVGLHLLHGTALSKRSNDAIQALLTNLISNIGDSNAEPNENNPEA